jgi:N-methylhydantoinase A
VHKRFFEAVLRSLKDNGLSLPIYILKADGGTMNMEASLEYPGQTILSGPAASVIGCIPYASPASESLVLDIGGTTTDMAVLIQGTPLLAPLGIQLGPFRTLIRSLETHSIGLGGDSTVRAVNGTLQLGPDRQGPAMAYGGSAPTPTDALFVLGRDHNGDVEAARRGIGQVAKSLRLPLEETATRVFDLACRKILEAAREMIDTINSKPVYTIHELLEGYQVIPKELLVLGGPAPYFAPRLGELSGIEWRVVPQCQLANAIGAALARTTCELSLFADTERGIATAPEEDFYQPVKSDFSGDQAVKLATDLLRQKAIREGAEPDDLEIELLERQQFNMVRSFYPTGRNIRVKVQVKPGLISRYRSVTDLLAAADRCPAPAMQS